MNKIKVFLTVDTEHSIGGAFENPAFSPVGNDRRIFGRLNRQFYGIPLIMDIAESYGHQVVFFVETLSHYFFGKNETRKIIEYILKRGHDIQLHVHPNYKNFETGSFAGKKFSDLINAYSLDEQKTIIKNAAAVLTELGARPPVAFRAGSFGANTDTLHALVFNNILIDSSYSQAYVRMPCLLPDWRINGMIQHNGIFELPITNFIENTFITSHRYKPLDINGVSYEEIQYVLTNAQKGHGPNHITILLHSFSFLKALDVQYQKFRIRFNVISRFKKLCRFLANNKNTFEVTTLGNLRQSELRAMVDQNKQFVKMPQHLSLLRYGSQLKDRLF